MLRASVMKWGIRRLILLTVCEAPCAENHIHSALFDTSGDRHFQRVETWILTPTIRLRGTDASGYRLRSSHVGH